MDKAAETTGWRQEGRKWQTQPFLMYLCLNVMHISSCSAHTGTPLHFSIIRPRHPKPSPNCNKKTWPWSRYCKSNKEEIDGWNDSGLILREGGGFMLETTRSYWFRDWWITRYSSELFRLFMASAIPCWYSKSSGFRLEQLVLEQDIGELIDECNDSSASV